MPLDPILDLDDRLQADIIGVSFIAVYDLFMEDVSIPRPITSIYGDPAYQEKEIKARFVFPLLKLLLRSYELLSIARKRALQCVEQKAFSQRVCLGRQFSNSLHLHFSWPSTWDGELNSVQHR